MNNVKLIARKWKHQQGGAMKRLNVKTIQQDSEYKNYDWYIDKKEYSL